MLISIKIFANVDYIYYICIMKTENIFNKEVKKRTNIKYNHNDDYFNEINTSKKAYILGFIIADGSINRTIRGNCITNRLTFCNSIDDSSIIEEIKNEISPESIVYIRNCQLGVKIRKPQCILKITSYKLCEDLINKYNIHPRKTHHSDFKFVTY